MHLVEISVVDQRYQAVMAGLQDGWKGFEVFLVRHPRALSERGSALRRSACPQLLQLAPVLGVLDRLLTFGDQLTSLRTTSEVAELLDE